ncbi:MAG: SAM-dependent methyltransferase, partial [Verrucomicrobiota bacterium]
MTDDLISQIQSFTLAARGALEAEAAQQLEGIYGWLPDGAFANPKGYPAIAHIDEARETRSRLEQFAEDEKVAGLDAKSARRKLIRETAFTWLNRLAAFRLMEERKLLKQTIVRLAQSNGFIFWLTDEKTPQGQQAYALHQQGALPLNAMGEGPSDIAYRRFLLWQCGELARDVSVLFDPGTVASRLCPRPPLLKQLVTDMNAAELADAWKTGNEETIGWIYQAFNAEELQAAFAGAREQGKKFEAEDIPAVTQLFTIRWVVRFLVENTLGRLWVEMHPDSRLKDSLGCLVPVENTQKRPLKLAREISFLDPCCGSMHFGLVAFDIFVEMYREEIEHAGQPGWPAKASVATAEEIPASIIANNLHGIDLDLRAVQLSALTLLLRARTLNPKCTFTDENLASANVEEITGGR